MASPSLVSDTGIKLTVSNLQDVSGLEVQAFLEDVLRLGVRVESGDNEGEYHLTLPTEEAADRVRRLSGCYVKQRALYIQTERSVPTVPPPSHSHDPPSYVAYAGASRTLSRDQLPSHVVSTRDLAKGLLTVEQVWAIYGEFGPLAAILYPAPSALSRGNEDGHLFHHNTWFLCYETREATAALLESPPLCFPTPIRFVLAQIPRSMALRA
ncbi:hypothetical protein GMRT_13347 [Giardia muris]|uniref:RRM domain-containing protein n=1 Tax=Giardia muris TaxID=5742 RepID=A0A4Z1SKZ5_GIAMU|nr:hypothetical protein GMRT_13347 [Giardia muris]|eukprot:TNJ26312.1 hypothetical protein GMRT_13347 [Giardia muris]